ncbi:DNA mismatch repair protein MSH3 [Rhizodiscina lignyota]|uniref:DNA mismatch repair protein n=1 Tax=Rhizodiscina lignyota TaxID=1504668 RepID=A0A9P4IBC0_9PEZI|nr:DNA mismatch repair protein MSH3 [Rhizodiscina lignyota]
MAPLSQTPSSQSKKQSSISSFFTPKPAAAPKPTSLTSASQANGAVDGDDDDTLYERPNQNTAQSRRKPSRGIKRVLDDDGSDVENLEPSGKKAKGTSDGLCDDGPPKQQPQHSPNLTTSAKPVRTESGSAGAYVKASERTSKYLFSSSPVSEDVTPQEPDDDATRQAKQRLHEKFVKKLGRPDSIAELKRRDPLVDSETDDAGDEVAEEDKESQPKQNGRKKAPKTSKLTPMVKQVIDLKTAHMDKLLVVEVGYKFKFFGEDARVAAKELGIVCIPGKMRFDEHPSEAHLNRFASASIPVHRLHVHVKRLVQAGHKVGVVRQLETAALKAVGDNRNAPFVRKLTNVYTKATYIDDVEGLQGDSNANAAPATGFMLCLTESNANFGYGSDEKVHVGIVAVQPATGDIIYDDFEDGFMRSDIETRLLHIAPAEFLIVGELSKTTEKLIKHLSGSKSNVFGDQARVERIAKSKTIAAESYSNVSKFYADKMKITNFEENGQQKAHILDKVHKLSGHVTICLSSMIEHMREYGLEHVFDLTKNFQPFSARSHMLLNGNTLTSLEIYQNQTDHRTKGSLFWTMDRTKTKFGQRLLRKWVGRPLLDQSKLEERIAAVEELKDGERTMAVDKLKHLLSNTRGDLEKSLIRIYYKKCARPELLNVFQSLQRISNGYVHVTDPSLAGFSSPILCELVSALPKINDKVIQVLDKINLQAARDNDKYNFFRSEHETEDMTSHSLGIAAVEADLDEHRKVAAEKLGKSKVTYVTVSQIEYLIEVENTQLKRVPASWAKISGTKKVSRFHTPEVVRMTRERDQHKESLAAACDEAFTALLTDISTHYQEFRDCIQSLATLDCLLSLAELAAAPGYAKPTFTSEAKICVREGRHPMVEQLLLDSYVPNDIDLNSSDPDATRALLITGPNMGGKSSYVRQIALISIMGQIGSYVPASSAELGILDAVYTRMGAQDNMMKGESTFMVELSETADILKQAGRRSLVILDELGRGTSTHDGVAIAEAVLRECVDRGMLLGFITHYQHLAGLEGRLGDKSGLRNVHMRFREEDRENGRDADITFLYEVGGGVAHRSYGLNVARLANIPKSVLDAAAVKSKEMEEGMMMRKIGHLAGTVEDLFSNGTEEALQNLLGGLEQL